jgi:hypothetical protein
MILEEIREQTERRHSALQEMDAVLHDFTWGVACLCGYRDRFAPADFDMWRVAYALLKQAENGRPEWPRLFSPDA